MKFAGHRKEGRGDEEAQNREMRRANKSATVIAVNSSCVVQEWKTWQA